MLTEYQRQLRTKYLSAPVVEPPAPWRAMAGRWSCVPFGGLLGVGFGEHPETGEDLLMVVSGDGFGLLEVATGTKIARDRDPDSEVSTPDGPDLACPGIGVLAGSRVRIAGLFGGGLHTTTEDGRTIDVVSPEWPHHRVILSADGGRNSGEPGNTWWHVFSDEGHGEFRAAGFSPTGRTLAIATASDVTLFMR
ncbi:hypothetical protein SAMN05421812_104246 [Asanoa hainanensis]|uniref:Uncharacterized protein n=2 Tax=Asanoa hainanensis TaxID=560556 RepID=A0A239LDL0_9ACTN|nr:hypothetical protein SAMN05421812_104246 [Asanoa hainanensis]